MNLPTSQPAGRVLIAALIFALAWFLQAPSVFAASECDTPVIGRREPVALSSAKDGPVLEEVARIDTGASYSSIDRQLASDLGIDLENARTVTIRSSLGEEQRPLVNVTLRVAGKEIQSSVTVTDRSGLSTEVLLGRRDLDGFLIDVTESRLTSPGESGCTGVLFGVPGNASSVRTLLSLMPFLAALVVGFRSLVGIQTFGVFAPILLALAFVQTGIVVGLPIFLMILLAGLPVQLGLRRLRLPRTARLAILMGLVALVVLIANESITTFAPDLSLVTALPIIVLATIVERFWGSVEQDGVGSAAWTVAWTLVVAVLSYPILVFGPVRQLAEDQPLAPIVLGVVLAIAFGRYHGLRLAEYWRFRVAAHGRRLV